MKVNVMIVLHLSERKGSCRVRVFRYDIYYEAQRVQHSTLTKTPAELTPRLPDSGCVSECATKHTHGIEHLVLEC